MLGGWHDSLVRDVKETDFVRFEHLVAYVHLSPVSFFLLVECQLLLTARPLRLLPPLLCSCVPFSCFCSRLDCLLGHRQLRNTMTRHPFNASLLRARASWRVPQPMAMTRRWAPDRSGLPTEGRVQFVRHFNEDQLEFCVLLVRAPLRFLFRLVCLPRCVVQDMQVWRMHFPRWRSTCEPGCSTV